MYDCAYPSYMHCMLSNLHKAGLCPITGFTWFCFAMHHLMSLFRVISLLFTRWEVDSRRINLTPHIFCILLYSWTLLSQTQFSWTRRYLRLIPLVLVFQSFTIGYMYLELPAISNCFLFPLRVWDSGFQLYIHVCEGLYLALVLESY